MATLAIERQEPPLYPSSTRLQRGGSPGTNSLVALSNVNDEAMSGAIGDALGAVEGAFDTSDPVNLGRAFAHAMQRAALRPWSTAPAWVRYGASLGIVGAGLGARVVGIRLPDMAQHGSEGCALPRRAWDENLVFHALLESYLLTDRLLRELVHAAQLEGPEAPKAEFAAQLLSDAMAPTNFLPTNPAALVRAFETAGGSVLRGARNLVRDVVEEQGMAEPGRPWRLQCRARTSRSRRARWCSATS